MFHKLFVFLLVASFLISACGNMPPIPISSTPTSAATLTPSATVTPTPAPSSTLTQTLTPSPTPLPVFIRGEFEYDFQSGVVPAELVAGGLGEVTFGIAQSAGGEISTEGMKSQNIIPLVKDGAVLNAVSGNVVFLPFPEKMLTEDGQEVSYSKDQSGQGWAAYTDASGNLLRKMITRIPNAATIVAGVSFNSSDRGTVYAVKLSASGEVQGKARLVFDDQTTLSVVFESGEVAIDINNQPSTPNFSNASWEVDLLRELEDKLSAAGVVFNPDTTSKLVRDNYAFTLRLSKGILARSGLRYVRLPDSVFDKLFLHSMGRFMYFQRNLYPVRYVEFHQAADLVATGSIENFNNPIYMQLAENNLKEGPVPFKFNNADISGSVSEMEMNMVSKNEFLNAVIPALHNEGMAYSSKAPWIDPRWDADVAAFINGNTLVIYAYDLERPEEQRDKYPLEIQDKLNHWKNFDGILMFWSTITILMQINFATDLSPEVGVTFTTQEFVCGVNPNLTQDFSKLCKDILDQTFIPGYKPVATPTP